ncbi:hypothetical protein HHJ74_07730 [Mobiluncus mulieris]|uniref:EC042-2821-like Restriction Endonuclease-like domain-containing protein n=1 Tax=Mobiluncus mulieris TaxID=2052 RepID=A0A848RLG6_9ACTO|nr:hypothetical protein [Mobiluncus mulieris]NMW93582.1 hypothetical protein [Mobiluncus mulieris]
MSNRIPENYLNLSVKRDIINDEVVRAKYSPEVAERLLELYNAAVIPGEDGSSRYASYYETSLIVVKNVEKADLAVRIDKEANVGIAIAKQTVDLQNKYPYTARKVWEEVNRQLQKHGVTFNYRDRIQDKFNNHHWTIMVKFYNLKTDPRYGYNRATKGEKALSYVYSQQTVELIVDSIRRNPHVLTDLLAKGFR